MRGWINNRQSDNFILRISCISHFNLDIGIAESHIIKTETLLVEEYHWLSHNRDRIHVERSHRLCQWFLS